MMMRMAVATMAMLCVLVSVSSAGTYTVTVNDTILDQARSDGQLVDSRPASRAQYVQRLITEWELQQRQVQHSKQKEVVQKEEMVCVESGKRFIITKDNERLQAVCE